MQSTVFTTSSHDLASGVECLLQALEIQSLVGGFSHILIKPNLVNTDPPPVTTPVGLVEAIVLSLQHLVPECTLSIGEGTGSTTYDTMHCFDTLGYTTMAARHRIPLIDLNTEPLAHKVCPECTRLPELYYPALLDEVFLLSVPVLKAHTLAGVTLTMKNMMGVLPPSHYQQGSGWGKSAMHADIDLAVAELNRYRTPDCTLMDCSIGMPESHLWGRHCDPPVGLLTASTDPVAIDSHGTQLLKKDWQQIGHIRLNNGIRGDAASFAVVQV
nr:DUF362 domain-containing protein [uncultured Desulfobulbus sp.]